MRVLVVEDERKTASFIRSALEAEHIAVDVRHTGPEALADAMGVSFDAIVLDIMLPGQDGLSVLRQLRQRRNRTPVLLLSARGEVNDRVEGLNLGADDYLAKPFVLAELVARLRALVRRGNEPKPQLLRVADLTLDTAHAPGLARRNDLRPRRARIPAAGISHALRRARLRADDHSRKGLGLQFRSGHQYSGCLCAPPAGED